MKKIVSIFLVFAILFALAVPAFAAEEENELTLDGMMEAFESGNKEALDVYFEALGVPTDESQLKPTIKPRWASSENEEDLMCHQNLTAYGLLLYLAAMQRMYGLQLSAMGYTFTDIQTLIREVRTPDSDYWTGVGDWFAGHFYDPDTQKNFCFETDNTAKSNLEKRYNEALTAYRNGNRSLAMSKLGHAIHYLQDLNEPHHASNITAPFTNHSKFEETASEMLLNEIAESDTMNTIEVEADFYYTYLRQSVGSSGHQAAVTAKGFVGLATNKNKTLWRVAAYFTLYNAMFHSSGLLFRFAKDTHMI